MPAEPAAFNGGAFHLSETVGPKPHAPIELRRNDNDVDRDATLSFQRPELKALLDLWQQKRKGRPMPARADFTPFDLKAQLGHLILVDVEPAPIRFRYRLVGTTITDILQRDVTGRYFEEIYTGPLLTALLEAFAWVVEKRAPLRIFSRTGHPGNPVFAYDCLLLPLCADGTAVNMVLGELRFTLLSLARSPAA
jgi:hypothetical protein